MVPLNSSPDERNQSSLPTPLMGEEARRQVECLQEAGLSLPPEHKAVFETLHHLKGGIYARTIAIPAGHWLVGAVHKKDHINVVAGDISVLTEEGVKRITGFHVLPTTAGVKRAGYAHATTYWTTLVRTDETALDAIEDDITTEGPLLQSRQIAIEGAEAPKLEH